MRIEDNTTEARPAMDREMPLELFRKACGLATPLRLWCQDASSMAEARSTRESPSPFLMIGRSPKNDLSLDDRKVSRRHAYVQGVAGRVAVVDLQSRTGITWEDEGEARSWGWLDPGQSIRIGRFRVERTDHPEEEGPGRELLDPFIPIGDEARLSHAFPRPSFELPFKVGGVAPVWELPGLLALVGREAHCQFVLNDESISRMHACLIRTPKGTWVVDLEAREGLFVNGTRVRWAWLADGDTVRFGRFTMIVRYDRTPEGIDRDDVPLDAGASPPDAPRSDDVDPADEPGRALALRAVARPSALVKSSGARPAPPATVDRGEWEPVTGVGPSPYALWQQQMQLMESFHNDMTMMVQMFIAMHREFQSSVRDELKRVQKLTQELGRLNAQLLKVPELSQAPPEAQPQVMPRKARRGTPTPTPKAGETPDQPATADRPSTPSGPRKESSEMYADITRRITELQRQRRGYWQRILKAING
jgi:pSer/pThr/pTyr-binding forkhead associated (FHA) protein